VTSTVSEIFRWQFGNNLYVSGLSKNQKPTLPHTTNCRLKNHYGIPQIF